MYLSHLIPLLNEHKRLGEKTGKGFYKARRRGGGFLGLGWGFTLEPLGGGGRGLREGAAGTSESNLRGRIPHGAQGAARAGLSGAWGLVSRGLSGAWGPRRALNPEPPGIRRAPTRLEGAGLWFGPAAPPPVESGAFISLHVAYQHNGCNKSITPHCRTSPHLGAPRQPAKPPISDP